MIEIDLAEKFPHLKNAPIVEAALEVRGDVLPSWDQEAFKAKFKERFPAYPQIVPLQSFQQQVTIQSSGPVLSSPDFSVFGMRADSRDKRNVVQFRRDAFAFSRLKPYMDFNNLMSEARKLLPLYLEITSSNCAQRLGLRFINQISTNSRSVDKILREYPKPPQTLPGLLTSAFLSQNTFSVPGRDYTINLTYTMAGGDSLIIDIDVFSTAPTPMANIEHKFAEMRWLKNKVFFGVLNDDVIRGFE